MRPGTRAAVFTGLYAASLPVTSLGYLLWLGSLVVNRGGGASATAQGPLSVRWVQHRLGERDDPAADRLVRVLPGVPPLGPRLLLAPLLLAHRVTGHVPTLLRYPFAGPVPPPAEVVARTAFLDAVLERHLPAVTQLVVLGAGFDTRAWRLPAGSAVTVFEVDTPRTQAVKRAMVAEAGLPTRHVRFVAADVERDAWLERLRAAGFDLGRPAVFLWEGVVMYLTAAAVEDTLRTIAGTAPGSVVAFDYLSEVPLRSRHPFWVAVRTAPRAVGEPFRFGVSSTPPIRARLAELLGSCGLRLDEHRALGEEAAGARAWGGFATAAVP